MIPKIIHYCWFGGNTKPVSVIKCISSWKKYLPDYEIVEWNEQNFLIDESLPYVKQAYKNKKWAFVSDYVRLKALYDNGGIYFDTDIEVFRTINNLLDCEGFLCFESNDYICTAVIAFEKENEILKEYLDSYNSRIFVRPDGSFDNTTNVHELTRILYLRGLKKNGKFQKINNLVVYPQYYFSSNDFVNIFGKYREGIYAFHHCLASWYDKERKVGKKELIKHYIIGKIRNYLGTDLLIRLTNI